MTSEQPPTSETDGGPRKRRRIQLACGTCRSRKTKCDGTRPICSPCRTRGVEASCSYDNATLPSQRFVMNLSRFIQISHNEPTSSDTARSPNQHLKLSNPEPAFDALGTATSPSSHAEVRYGNSSTIAFSSSLRKATCEGQHSSDSSFEGRDGGIHGLEITKQPDQGAFLLPPRHIADDFLRCYWEFMHPLFPIWHRPSFDRWYQRIWEPQDAPVDDNNLDRMIMYSTLNVMLALGCRFSTIVPPRDRIASADDIYKRSRKLLTFDILDSMHLTLVQLLLLMGTYLQSARHADRFWNVIGLAIRVAQGLGLHTEQSPSEVKSQRDIEMRRRVWHTCVLLDRLSAMSFGCPTMVAQAKSSTAIPAMIDDDFLLEYGIGTQPSQLPSRMALFVYSLRLFDILDEILTTCYPIRPSTSSQPDDQHTPHLMNDILRLNGALDVLYEDIPSYLKPEDSARSVDPHPEHVTLQKNVFRSRFLYVRILLFRPILLKEVQRKRKGRSRLSERFKPTLQESLETRSCTLCIETALTLVTHISETKESLYGSSAWHSVYLTFAAAMILVAGRLCDFNSSEISQDSIKRSWSIAFDILTHYQAQVPAASRAFSVLEASIRQNGKSNFTSTQSQMHEKEVPSFTTQMNEIPNHTPELLSARQTEATSPDSLGSTKLSQNAVLQLYPGTNAPILDQNCPLPVSDTVSALPFQVHGMDNFGPIDDLWFTQNFVESNWFDAAKDWDQGGLFF
ncbi:uncharacterized protein LY89DRAFT_599295 [Mollisia scopiformis]|uniref:Zn(2)-C6 fungal-type domain-containing protein n=1 Tax=Mollisia scopiformis TaxID=149040 RepID=A0A132B935_MOLSC|nr:uncharacterized protein LY89DRAFT_599295 [Mollisia scopiformis]KUJ08915.1 hypothetical protein LY89DRAFT_599295 [Mollisia scopiformis]